MSGFLILGWVTKLPQIPFIGRVRITTKRESSNAAGVDSAACTVHAPFSPLYGKTTLAAFSKATSYNLPTLVLSR
ncbi:MAG TPA: hypothetical protein DCE55_01605 [Planctomycetaceae bacterium]|nr:hypothetical protein [Planctomycetaceae bacterium]|tara:strand:- start:9236 stop:9460 length:225 start_codon:yes stop_codon:yes gene_type:complete